MESKTPESWWIKQSLSIWTREHSQDYLLPMVLAEGSHGCGGWEGGSRGEVGSPHSHRYEKPQIEKVFKDSTVKAPKLQNNS